MKKYEDQVCHMLKLIIAGSFPRALTVEQSLHVVQWVTLMTIVHEMATEYRTIERRDIQQFRASGLIPETWQMFAAHVDGYNWSKKRTYHNFALLERLYPSEFVAPVAANGQTFYNGHVSTIGIGNLLFHSGQVPSETHANMFKSLALSFGLQQIWPVRRRGLLLKVQPIEFPLSKPLSDEDAERLSNAFHLWLTRRPAMEWPS